MTGGGRGCCSPWGVRAGRGAYWGRGWGRGRGGYGFGYGNVGQGFVPGFATRVEEMDYLKSEAEALRRSLEGIEARMRDLTEKGQ